MNSYAVLATSKSVLLLLVANRDSVWDVAE